MSCSGGMCAARSEPSRAVQAPHVPGSKIRPVIVNQGHDIRPWPAGLNGVAQGDELALEAVPRRHAGIGLRRVCRRAVPAPSPRGHRRCGAANASHSIDPCLGGQRHGNAQHNGAKLLQELPPVADRLELVNVHQRDCPHSLYFGLLSQTGTALATGRDCVPKAPLFQCSRLLRSPWRRPLSSPQKGVSRMSALGQKQSFGQ